jgi:ferredoxin
MVCGVSKNGTPSDCATIDSIGCRIVSEQSRLDQTAKRVIADRKTRERQRTETIAGLAILSVAEGQPSCGFESRRPHQRADGDRGHPGLPAGSIDLANERGKRGLNVFIDPNRCVGNAACTWAAPGIYTLDEETRVAVLENEDIATIEQLFAGARACPTKAIIVSQFGRRVYPTILPPMFGETMKSASSDETETTEEHEAHHGTE